MKLILLLLLAFALPELYAIPKCYHQPESRFQDIEVLRCFWGLTQLKIRTDHTSEINGFAPPLLYGVLIQKPNDFWEYYDVKI